MHNNIRIAPTLRTMADVYALSREGGAQSERFLAYVAKVPTQFGLVPYNPMAGETALAIVLQLIAMNAEDVAHEAAKQVAERCQYPDAITLAIAVRSKGLWTDRIGTEVDERVTGKARVAHHGIVSIWSREECSAADVARESAAETVRVMWHAMHGVADTLKGVFACEGLAYALAGPLAGLGRYSRMADSETAVAVMEALEVLGDSRQPADVCAVMYGDEVAEQMGYAPLGIAEFAGYRCAITRARDAVARIGAAKILGL